MINIPLVKGFKSTNRINAFLLNSLKSALVIVLTIATKDYFDKYIKINVKHTDIDDDNKYDDDHVVIMSKNNIKSLLLSFVVAFSISMLSFMILYVVFGFGGGLITTEG